MRGESPGAGACGSMAPVNAERHVLSFGEALWDRLPGGAVPGGAAMNLALHLQAAGVPVDVLTRIGNDAAGRDLQRFMEERGLSTRCLQLDQHHATGYVDVDLSEPEAPKFDIHAPVAWDFIDAEALLAQRSWVDVIVYGTLASRNAASRSALLRLLPEASLRVFDINLRLPRPSGTQLAQLLQAAQWAKFNEAELHWAGALFHCSGERDAVAQALRQRFDLELLCLTLGADGAVLYTSDKIYRQSGFEVSVVDSVGCGDAFLGAFLASALQGNALELSLGRASAVAALVATRPGGAPCIHEADIAALLRH